MSNSNICLFPYHLVFFFSLRGVSFFIFRGVDGPRSDVLSRANLMFSLFIYLFHLVLFSSVASPNGGACMYTLLVF